MKIWVSQINPAERRVIPPAMPDWDYGECSECRNEALLGDGLCVTCWDKDIFYTEGWQVYAGRKWQAQKNKINS